MNKDNLTHIYWILEAVKTGLPPNPSHVDECLVALRDDLTRPDTEEMVDHIRGALLQQEAAAGELTRHVLGGSRRHPLSTEQLLRLSQSVTTTHPLATPPDIEWVQAFARLIQSGDGVD